MQEIKIKVKHFKKAMFYDALDCPLARAIREQMGAKHLNVGVNTFSITTDYGRYINYTFTPKYSAREFLYDKKRIMRFWFLSRLFPSYTVRTVKVCKHEVQ